MSQTMTMKNDTKCIIHLPLPETCGRCKLLVKTINGRAICYATKKTVSVDSKSHECILEPLPKTSAKKKLPLPKLTECSKCNSNSFNKHTKLDNAHFKYIECRKCGRTSEGCPGRTWREAIEGWNTLNTI